MQGAGLKNRQFLLIEASQLLLLFSLNFMSDLLVQPRNGNKDISCTYQKLTWMGKRNRMSLIWSKRR